MSHIIPSPDVFDDLTAPFWRATREHTLQIQRCELCTYLRWPPARFCPECHSERSNWVDVRPTGTLWSIAEYHRSFSPPSTDNVPYTVALIELDDGPRMYGTMLGDPRSFVLDEPVEAVFVHVNADVTQVQWAMATHAAG
jgi:uncharacterized OB-fold protein